MRYAHTLLTAVAALSLSCAHHNTDTVAEPLLPDSNTDAVFDDFSLTANSTVYDALPLLAESDFYNPILPGWNSDPSICRVNNDFYLVTSTFAYYPGVPIFHSRDLLNWSQIGYALSRPSQLLMLGQPVSGGIFAPQIRYNEHNKTFYIITTDVGKMGNFFVKATDPRGPWSDPIPLPDVHGIDPSFFFDSDGKAYIVNNDDAEGAPQYDGHRTIRARQFDIATDKTVGPEVVLVDKGANPADNPIWIEGPHLYKLNGAYYLMAAEGGTGDWHSEVLFRADSPLGPYTPLKNNPILTQRDLPADRPNPVTCAGHADIVDDGAGNYYACFLACRPVKYGAENTGRETFMMPVNFDSDGAPYITKPGDSVPYISSIKGAKRGDRVTFGNVDFHDSFDSQTLDLGWLSLRGPADSVASLTTRPGSLVLSVRHGNTSDKGIPAFLARRIPHEAFSCFVNLSFSPRETTETAGLVMFKDEDHQYQLCVGRSVEGEVSIQARRVTASSPQGEILAQKPLDTNKLRLRIDSPDGLTVSMSFSSDNCESWTTLVDSLDAAYLSTRDCGGFTGTTIGPFRNAF